MVQLSSMLPQYEPDVYDVGGASSAAQVLLTVLTERKLLYYGWSTYKNLLIMLSIWSLSM